jgi:2'-5' RNA ligase
MTGADNVAGDESLRLFLALRIPDGTMGAIERWQHEELRNVRVVPRGHLHVTLAFLGHRPSGELPAIVGALRDASAGAGEIRLTVLRYRDTRSVGMLVLEDEGGGATRLASDVQERLERLGVYRREGRPWLPHVTVARWRERPRLRPEPPPRRTFVPSDAAAYLSRLRRGGADYRVLESVALGTNVGGE